MPRPSLNFPILKQAPAPYSTFTDSIKKNTVADTIEMEMIQKEMATASLGLRNPCRGWSHCGPGHTPLMIAEFGLHVSVDPFYRTFSLEPKRLEPNTSMTIP